MNILYLDDYINYYDKGKKEIFKFIPYKDTLKYGKIINKVKFIKKITKEFDKLGIKNSLFLNSITIIINNSYSYEDKELLKVIMDELNYKNIKFISEDTLLNVNKNSVYLVCNYSFFYILYTNRYGNLDCNIYTNNIINKNIFINIIDNFNNRNIIIYGKNSNEFMNILDRYSKDYYVYEEKSNLVIKKFLLCNDKSF